MVALNLKVLCSLLCLYTLGSWALSTVLATIASLYQVFQAEYFQVLLLLVAIGVPFLLIGIGLVSLLPLSEYFYMRGGGINPAIARESAKHQKRKREDRTWGFMMGIVGFTSLFMISPGHVFFRELVNFIEVPLATTLMWIILFMLAAVYKMKLNMSKILEHASADANTCRLR